MPTYQYETIPVDHQAPLRRFEMRQGFTDPVLTNDPDSGAPVRRVISGGLGVMTKSQQSLPEPGPGCGPGSCGCGRF
ncbi:MAG: zinc ribbon domain-containing protein [Gemmatimonadaceae bacterium]